MEIKHTIDSRAKCGQIAKTRKTSSPKYQVASGCHPRGRDFVLMSCTQEFLVSGKLWPHVGYKQIVEKPHVGPEKPAHDKKKTQAHSRLSLYQTNRKRVSSFLNDKWPADLFP